MIRSVLGAGVAAVLVLGACEEAGEDIDSAIEKTVDGEKDLGDGAFEKAGQAVDDAIGVDRKNEADSLADAVDGERETKPD